MTRTIIFCADGSELATEAARHGLALLKTGDRTIVTTVAESPDQAMLVGSSGFAGGTVTPETFESMQEAARAVAMEIVDEMVRTLGDEFPDDYETQILAGSPGHAICNYAAEENATTIVIGSRGRSGIARAVLGSVSDHVVRNAPCAVLIFGDHAEHVEQGDGD